MNYIDVDFVVSKLTTLSDEDLEWLRDSIEVELKAKAKMIEAVKKNE
tara:strand:- start:704 stop:844 length:141 start_codon:yes stop_codon:yes gene_type:complete